MTVKDSALFDTSTDYKRDLGLMEVVSVVVGRIIGSGIFRTPAPIMALVMSTSLFGLVWLVGGIVTIFGAVCYAELVAMMPKSGGPYVYLRAAYHPICSFLRGWAMFFVSETGAIAAVAIVFAEYAGALFTIITGDSLSRPLIIVIALATIWILTVVNLFGVFLSGMVQNVFSWIKILAVGGIIGIAFSSGKGNVSNFTSHFFPDNFSWETILAVGAALRYSFFAFSGWEGATYIAEEVKNPSRNLPLSLLLGITGVIILYIGANSAYLYLLPVEVISSSKWVATEAMQVAIGSAGGILISAAVMMNTFGNVSTQILVKARSWQAMARDGVFFKKLGELHPKYKTPNNALIVQAAWATVLMLFAATAAKSSYEAIIDFFSATGTIFNIMTFASVIILRKKYKDIERPYKAWFYPVSVIVVIAIYIAFLVFTLVTALVPSLTGFLLTSSGLVYYYRKEIVIFVKRKTGVK
ncbi:MAG: amino acid permease [Spirochaetia bacterium]|nr:amino acid permease [Spirochaetia bacterium]